MIDRDASPDLLERAPLKSKDRERFAALIARKLEARAVALGRICLRRRLILDAILAARPPAEAAARAPAGPPAVRTDLVHAITRAVRAFSGPAQADLKHIEEENGALWFSSRNALIAMRRRDEAPASFIAILFDDRGEADETTALRRQETALMGLLYEHERSAPRQDGDVSAVADAVLRRLTIGLAIIDGQSRIIWANGAAFNWIERRDAIGMTGGRLTSEDPSLRRQIMTAADDAAGARRRPGAIVMPLLESDRVPSIVSFLPIGEAKALVIFPAQSQDALLVDILLNSLGLTRAERRLASQLCFGLDLEEAARASQVTKETARSYLKRIFAKTGVRRQSELIALVAAMTPPVVAPELPELTMMR